MQLISPDYGVATEGGVAPFEEVALYPRSQRQADFPSGAGASNIGRMSPPSSPVPHIVTAVISTTTATTTTTATATTTATTRTSVSKDQENRHPPSTETPVRPECLHRHQTTCHGTNSSLACDCESGEGDAKDPPCALCRGSQLSNSRKRKFIESAEEESDVLTHCHINIEKYKRLLLTRKRLLSNLAQRNNVPLFYLYGDLLLIPKYKWGSDVGFGGGRRTSLNDTELTPSFDLGTNLEAYHHHHHHHHPHPRSSTSSLVQVCPDSQSLEESGLGPTWITDILPLVMQDLNRYGVCVVDNFLGSDKAQPILQEVEALHVRGLFEDGQVVSPNVQDQARGIIRGDKITWVTGNEPQCANIRRLVSAVDSIIAKANHHQDAGQLAKYSITWRSRAMVACYPGQGARYVKHVDNPDGDGRCITAIYYINKDWTPEGGGVLRIYPEGNSQVAEIEPLFDRMLFFWSDRRNPHEVLPANVTRYAITLWYYDQKEREEYLSRASASTAST
ncbi:uncharacterized protein Hph isoform X2 [Macrobrachium rosenbergii]|uniref:uncharacterized protein Hph isoform X2 n=1 Tax=Macrobrachium rosenbergii TaxID=79674 RepID=UPI0034D59527